MRGESRESRAYFENLIVSLFIGEELEPYPSQRPDGLLDLLRKLIQIRYFSFTKNSIVKEFYSFWIFSI